MKIDLKLKIKNLKLKGEAAFTLIELLVAISIISTVSVMGIASFLAYSRSQILNTAAMDVVTMLETARSRALTQIKPASCGAESLEGYTVVLGATIANPVSSINNNYEFSVRCGGVDKPDEIISKKLPNSITFSNGTPLRLRFLLLGNGVVKISASDEVIGLSSGQTITLTGPGGTKTVTVFSDGRITYD